MIPACIILVLALAAAAGSVSFLGPCVHEDGTFGACHWAGQALLGTSVLMAVLSLTALVYQDAGPRRGLFLAMIFTAVLGILIPGTLIGLCGMATMRCRALMRPAMTILNTVMGLCALAGFFFSRERQ